MNIKSIEIANTVYYYPLIQGIDNFLKRPVVKISNQEDSLQIIEDGVRDFLNTYKDKTYAGDLTSKLAIYCGKGKHKSAIDYLEEEVYPCVEMCIRDSIKGAVRLGWAWAIPKDAEKPEDARRRRKSKEKLRRGNDNVL